MADAPSIHSSRINRQMDHLIMALKVDPQHERPDFLLSLYWLDYTVEAGEPDSGHVAYLWSSSAPDSDQTNPSARIEADGLEAAFTDNPNLAQALGASLRPRQWPMTRPERPVLPARFERQNLRPFGIGYRIVATDLIVEARWEDLSSPVFSSGPTRGGDAWIATLLVESMRPSAFVNDMPQPGRSFPNPIWRPWFGDERGSCILGLGETIYEPLTDGARHAGQDPG